VYEIQCCENYFEGEVLTTFGAFLRCVRTMLYEYGRKRQRKCGEENRTEYQVTLQMVRSVHEGVRHTKIHTTSLNPENVEGRHNPFVPEMPHTANFTVFRTACPS